MAVSTSQPTVIQALSAVAALALVAGLHSPAAAHPLAFHPARTGGEPLRISRVRAPIALPERVLAHLTPGHSIYASRGRRMNPNFPYTTASVVFGSDYGANEVDAFKQSAGFPYVASLTDATPNACSAPHLSGPQGMWVDKLRNLWVADTNNSDLREFAVGQTTSAMNLSDPGYYPVDAAVDSDVTGNLYATNIISTSGLAGNIVGWTPPFVCGAAPNITMSDPTFQTVYFISTDKVGDLYVDYFDTTSTARVCFIAAANIANNAAICTATLGDFVTTVGLGFPGGMQVLPLPPAINKIGIVDQLGDPPVSLGVSIYKLPLPSAGPRYLPCTVVDPPFSVPLSAGPFGDPVTLAFTNAKGYALWASDATSAPGGALLRTKENVCSTSPGAFTGKITGFAQLIGTAVSPSVSP
jgi:hypothetical protein